MPLMADMSKHAFPRFTPPSAGAVRAHLHAFSPQPPQPLFTWGPPALMLVLLLGCLAFNHPLLWLLLLILFGVMWLVVGYRLKQIQWIEHQVYLAQELAMLRQWGDSCQRAWELLPMVHEEMRRVGLVSFRFAWRVPMLTERLLGLHGRCVALMGQNLERMRYAEPAIEALDYIASHLESDHPGSAHLHAQRAMLMLEDNRLTDADDLIRRVSTQMKAAAAEMQRTRPDAVSSADHPMPGHPGDPTLAAVRMAELMQAIATHHDEDAAALEPTLRAALQPLGNDAAEGYALMALAHYRMASRHDRRAAEGQAAVDATADSAESNRAEMDPQSDDHQQARERAQHWWSLATHLRQPRELVWRYPELGPLTADPTLKATPWPLGKAGVA